MSRDTFRSTRTFALLILALSILRGIAADDAASTNSAPKIDADLALKPDEIKSVLELSKQCGVSQVSHIYRCKSQSADFIIGVTSALTVRGREVSFTNILVYSEDRRPSAKERAGEVLKSNGKYWVRSGGIVEGGYTNFTINGRTVGIQLCRGSSLPVADRIVEHFASGRIRFANDKAKTNASGIDFSHPMEIYVAPDKTHFNIFFDIGDWTIKTLHCTLDSDGVTVTDVSTMVA